MSIVRFISDFHFSHTNMAISRGFLTIEEHDEFIIEKFNSVVTKRDTTYILGDITMETSKPYHLLSRLNGTKHVILGNHDKRQHIKELLKYVDSVSGVVKYKDIFLSHIPVHPMELEYRISKNIHGHLHEKVITQPVYEYGNMIGFIPDERYICVSCEQVNYIPKTLEELGITR
jgi:calcineurin-like phosphoesterase family protein